MNIPQVVRGVEGQRRPMRSERERGLSIHDAALGQVCGHATRAVMRRMFEEYGDERFERLATISNGQFPPRSPTRKAAPGSATATRM